MAEGNNIAASLRVAQVVQHNPEPLVANNGRQYLQQALDLTRATPIGGMNRQDIDALNKELHERPQLLATSNRFHYVKLAHLFGVPKEEVCIMENAEAVLTYINQTQKVEITVAEFLIKLEGCGQCYNVVRRLCNQIIRRDREQH